MRETVELTDPRALRALAHPTRLALVGLLRRQGPLTATQAGERLGESPASCSFHLRQLARWGLVEEAGGGRGRERPWRATARSTAWTVRTDEDAAASAGLSRLVIESQFAEVLGWLDRMPGEAPRWREAQQLADTLLRLTPEELEELGGRVLELVRSYERAEAPEGARSVAVFFSAVPRPEEATP